MKLTKLTITNIGAIAHEEIELNKPLILFYGDIRQGKTTLLNAVRWCFGGAFPADIIRHGEKAASIELGFDGGFVRREFYVSPESGETKARDLIFTRDGNPTPVKRPVEALREFLNPFMLDQNHFANLSEPGKQRFFVELLGVDTGELDAEFADLAEQRRNLEAKVAGYGDLDLTPVEEIDVIGIRKQLAARRAAHASQVKAWQTELDGLRAQHAGGKRKELEEAKAAKEARVFALGRIDQELADLRQRIARLEVDRAHQMNALEADEQAIADLAAEVAALPDLKPQADALKVKIATPLDTADLDAKLEQAAANTVRVEVYRANVAKAEQRKRDNELLDYAKGRQKEIKTLKAQRLAEIAAASGVVGLSFDEEGNFLFEGVAGGMLSTSQVMRLSSALSALYPEGFGLELIDRAESLGKAVFEFVDKAKREGSTILATIVGERPARVPEDVGVFVVEGGQLK